MVKKCKKWRKQHYEENKKCYIKYPNKYNDEYWKKAQFNTTLKKLNLTVEQYNEIMQKQEEKCAICRVELNSLNSKAIHKDHNHKTGKFRGILCKYCNSILGFSNENIQILENAIEYLKIHQ